MTSRIAKVGRYASAALLAVVSLLSLLSAVHAQTQKPNILFIMGDDIGIIQPSIYHRGLMVGETPNIDRIGQEGALFMTYYAEQSCTAGRTAFFTGMHPIRAGMVMPQLSMVCPATRSLSHLATSFSFFSRCHSHSALRLSVAGIGRHGRLIPL